MASFRETTRYGGPPLFWLPRRAGVLGRSDDLRIWDSQGRWRDLPERLGNYQSVKRRYYRWIEMGVLDDVLAALSREADLEWLMIDSTIVRAHQHAAGARTEKGGADAQGLGRSRDGLSPKIHAAGDALGNPLRLSGTPGQATTLPSHMNLSMASLQAPRSPTRL
jgi:transposase